MNVEKMTPQQLRKMADELEVKLKQTPITKPESEINVQKFIEFAREVRDKVARGDYYDDSDYKQWAFELIMQEIFGKDYFKWHNSVNR